MKTNSFTTQLDEEEKESQKITISEIPEEKKSKVFAHGKILDDFGNVIGTF